MDTAPAQTSAPGPSTALTATPPPSLPGLAMDLHAPPLPLAPTPEIDLHAQPLPLVPPREPVVVAAWPAHAHWAAGILVGIVLTLLVVHLLAGTQAACRPTEVQRAPDAAAVPRAAASLA